jgi:hypothetical protein
LRADPGGEAVPMQAAGPVALRQDRDLARGIERGCGKVVEVFGHGSLGCQVIPKRINKGSTTPASAKPLARNWQESHWPQGWPAAPGS